MDRSKLLILSSRIAVCRALSLRAEEVEQDNGDIQITTVVTEADMSEMSDFYHRLQECQRRTNHPFRNIEAMTVLPWAASPFRMNRDIIAGFLVVTFILYLLIAVFWRTIVSENHNPLVVSFIVAACLTPFLAVQFQCCWLKKNLSLDEQNRYEISKCH